MNSKLQNNDKKNRSVISTKLPVLLHAFLVLLYSYTLYYLVNFVIIPPRTPNHAAGGRWKYLTHWNFCLQLVYFLASFICEMFISSPRSHREVRLVDRILNAMFHGIVLPLGLYVFSTFWGLYLIDRELIFPRALDRVFPYWANHVLHTVIAGAVILESALVYRKRPSDRICLLILSSVFVSYTLWTLYLALSLSVWVYPFMELMDWPSRITAVILFYVFWLVLYRLGGWIHVSRWPKKFQINGGKK